MLYSEVNILPRSVFWSADSNGRSDNTDVIQLKPYLVIFSYEHHNYSLSNLKIVSPTRSELRGDNSTRNRNRTCNRVWLEGPVRHNRRWQPGCLAPRRSFGIADSAALADRSGRDRFDQIRRSCLTRTSGKFPNLLPVVYRAV